MLTKLEIQGFRKFDSIKLDDLGRINILVGSNNTGKTTLLEAVFGASCGDNFIPLEQIVLLGRAPSPFPLVSSVMNHHHLMEVMLGVFHRRDRLESLQFSFSGEMDGQKFAFHHRLEPAAAFAEFFPGEIEDYSTAAHLMPDEEDILRRNNALAGGTGSHAPAAIFIGRWKICAEAERGDGKEPMTDIPIFFPYPLQPQIAPGFPFKLCTMTDILSHRDEMQSRKVYAMLKREGLERLFIDRLNDSFSMQVESLENIPYANGEPAPISLRMKDGSMLPLYAWGDGVRRWFYILGNMIVRQGSIHCIEEIDVTFHHSAQEALSSTLCQYAEEFDNQLFMTTHNGEFLKTFLEKIEKEDEGSLTKDIRILTLRDGGGEARDFSYRILDGKEALWAVRQGLELRL